VTCMSKSDLGCCRTWCKHGLLKPSPTLVILDTFIHQQHTYTSPALGPGWESTNPLGKATEAVEQLAFVHAHQRCYNSSSMAAQWATQ
jgi:hypothetical protein